MLNFDESSMFGIQQEVVKDGIELNLITKVQGKYTKLYNEFVKERNQKYYTFLEKIKQEYEAFYNELSEDCIKFINEVDSCNNEDIINSIIKYKESKEAVYNNNKLIHLLLHYVSINGLIPISLRKVEKYMNKYYSHKDIQDVYKHFKESSYTKYHLYEDINLAYFNDWIQDERNFKV